MATTKEREFYGSEEVAEIFLVHPATVRRWLINKTLHGKKIGKKWLIPIHDVERLRAEIKQTGEQPDPV